MSKNTILVAIASGLVGFIVGFLFTNTLNRNEAVNNAAIPANIPPGQMTNPQATTLTPQEIQERIAMADNTPNDFNFQKNLGLSLYRYASLKEQPDILPDAIRILKRALDMDPVDRDVVIGLGNAYFDTGYFNKDNAALVTAREYYNKALERVPTDSDVRADLALTYFLHDPPDFDSAVAQFEKGLTDNPRNKRALQFLAQTYIKQGNLEKATATVERLKAADPTDPSIDNLRSEIAKAGTN